MEEHFLPDVWCLYFHDPYDSNWEKSGYKLIHTISTIEDFAACHCLLNQHWSKGMFFLMREYVFPQWDAEENKKGGVLTLKVINTELLSFWLELCGKLLLETLLKPEYYEKSDHINGISVSPKRDFCIIKIWISSQDLKSASYFRMPPSYHGDIIFKSHASSMQCEKIKQSQMNSTT